MVFAALAAPLMAVEANAAGNDSDSLAGKQKVHVAFRDMNAEDILGGVSVVNYEELAEKNYTTYSLENMHGVVGGWNGNSLWGMDSDNMDTNDSYGCLVLIDGVPRASNNVLPSEISQITFLKGAQAVVLYGSKAAKGAILITTKRGRNDGLQVKANANTGWHVAKAFPEYLGSAEYMTLYNEARVNDDNSPLYSATDIYNHASGINPYRYTDVNYYSDEYIRKAFNRSEFTAEISGGAKLAHFYTNVSYYRYEDLLDFGEAKNNYTDRFNVRGNVDLEVASFMKAYANANATFYSGRSGMGNFWNAAATVRPNFPQGAAPLIPISMIDPSATGALELLGTSSNIVDGQYFLGGTQANPTNDIAAGYVGGKNQFTSRQFQFDAGLDIDLSAVTKGLSFKTMLAVDYATTYTTSFNNTYAVYVPMWSNYGGKDVIVGLSKEGNEQYSGVQNISGSTDRQTIAFNAHFDYDRTFLGAHHVSAMAVANGFQRTVSGQYHRYSNANLGFQLNYDFMKRYYLDFSMAYVHSARLPEGNRGAASPSVTVGWRLGNEPFMKDNGIVDDLMISVSRSVLNEDIDILLGDKQFYLYQSLWSTNWGYGWNDGSSKQYTFSTQGSNPDLSYIKRKEWSVNLRASLFDKMITADFSFFTNDMDGYLISSPSTFPSHLKTGYPDGSFMPVMNNDINRRTGFDFSITGHKKFGEFDAALGVSGTYYDTEIIKRDETYAADQAYRRREGRPVDGIWGLQSCGLFQSDEDIKSYGITQSLGSEVRPGDIKYVDQNGDNIIDEKDEVFLGKGGWYGSPFTLGVNLTLKWKNFTLFMLGTGSFGAYGLKNSSYYWVSGDSKYSAVVRDRWTKETAETATYPRLSALGGQNNFRASDFWLYKTDRFDLRKVQLTYDMPKKWFAGTMIDALAVYVSGSDLLTISPERKHMEMNIGSAPQTRFYNLGVKVTL